MLVIYHDAGKVLTYERPDVLPSERQASKKEAKLRFYFTYRDSSTLKDVERYKGTPILGNVLNVE
jgi:hypothetical protein